MGEISRKDAVDEILSHGVDLLEVLKDKKDINTLTQCLDQSKSLQSSCDADFTDAQNAIQEYQKKIDICKQKMERAKAEVTAEDDDHLQRELEEELEQERALQEELRVITNEINDLDRQRVVIEEQKRNLKKFEQDELRSQMKLSMYASVTNIIPNLDNQSKISGCIVDRDKNVIDKFEYDSAKMTDFDICRSIWKSINL